MTNTSILKPQKKKKVLFNSKEAKKAKQNSDINVKTISRMNSISLMDTECQSVKHFSKKLPPITSPRKKITISMIRSPHLKLSSFEEHCKTTRSKHPKFFNTNKLTSLLSKCQNEITTTTKLTDKIGDYSKKSKYNYKQVPLFRQDKEQKEIRHELIHYEGNKYSTPSKKNSSHCTEVEKLDTITKISERVAFVDRKQFFSEENFSSDGHFYFDKEVMKLQSERYMMKNREKFMQKMNLNNSINKVMYILDSTKKDKEKILKRVSKK